MTPPRRRDVPDDARLLTALSRHWLARIDLSDPAHERFLDWLAKDTRARQSPAERAATERESRAFAATVLRRRRAQAVGVLPLPGRPDTRSPAVPGTVLGALAEAERHRAAPLLDLRVAAGAGRALWDEECDRWVTLPDGLPRGSYLAVRVHGDSMQPLLAPGDVVLVRLGTSVRRGSVVVARLPDDGYVVKSVGRAVGRSLELRSLNPDYAPLTFPRRPDTVLGTVVACWNGQDTAASR